jgi:death-on-curing protein
LPTNRRHYRVTLEDVFGIHQRALEFGGLPGIRDQGLIESAIARPFSGYYRSIAGKAAALTHSLALNHGFIDGNKRTALLAVALFVRKSDYMMHHKSRKRADDEMEAMILAVVEHRMNFDALVNWFRERLVPVK